MSMLQFPRLDRPMRSGGAAPAWVAWSIGVACVVVAVSASGQSTEPRLQSSPYTTMDGFHSPFARVAQEVSPAVVFIEVRKDGDPAPAGPYGGFFEDFTPRGRGSQPPHQGWIRPSSALFWLQQLY